MYNLVVALVTYLTSHVLCCVGKVSLRYSYGNGQKPAAFLVWKSDVEDVDVVKSSPFATTYANTNDMNPGLYEVPVSMNKNQYETVEGCKTVEQATENPSAMLPLYDSVGHGGSSAASSLFYQYVPSKVRTLL